MVANPLVSILINNYNYVQFVNTAIDSALAQTYENVEVIIVDDGSTDSSQEVITMYADRIIAILKENGGQASAFNAGFAACKGDIICFLDADDAFLPGKVSEVVRKFEKYPESGWFYHSLRQVNLVTGESVDRTSSVPEGEYDGRSSMLKGHLPFPGPATSGLCFIRTLLRQILPMPEAKNITMSDMYVKDLAIGLSKGYFSNRVLAIQNIHQCNLYTGRKDSLRTKTIIAVQYAYWMRANFPQFTERANRMFAIALQYIRWLGDLEDECISLMREYWSTTSLMTRVKIRLLMFYYRFRLKP